MTTKNRTPGVSIHLAWRKPGKVTWQTVKNQRTLTFGQVEGQVCFPLARQDVWKRFAVQQPSEADIEALCLSYGYLVMPGHSNNDKEQAYSFWAWELRLLWIVARLSDLLRQPRKNTLNDEVRAILTFEDIYRYRQLNPFKNLLLASPKTAVREERQQVLIYSSENHEQEISSEKELQSWHAQDWVLNADGETVCEDDQTEHPNAEAVPDYESMKKEFEQGLKPSTKVMRYKKKQDLQDAYQYFDWKEDDLQIGIQKVISSYTADISIDIDLPSRQLRLMPKTLLAGLWLQFSLWVLKGKHDVLSLCPHCGRIVWKRKGTKHCSDACKMALFRANQAEQNDTKVSLPRHNQSRKRPNRAPSQQADKPENSVFKA